MKITLFKKQLEIYMPNHDVSKVPETAKSPTIETGDPELYFVCKCD